MGRGAREGTDSANKRKYRGRERERENEENLGAERRGKR